jgi:hypothetical protein
MKNRTGIIEAGSQVEIESGLSKVPRQLVSDATMPEDENLSSGKR